MSFFLDERIVSSEKNGKIIVHKRLGQTEVYVDGYDQSTGYISTMWRKALTRIPKNYSVKHVLLLGLGAGNAVREITRRFPKAHITAVEWDPVMIELAKQRNIFSASRAPELIEDDAVMALENMQQTFDVILIDLFCGETPEPRLASEAMSRSLSRVLERDGYLLLNPFKTLSLIPVFSNAFSLWERWQYKWNWLVVFRHFGQGHFGDPLPQKFVHPNQSPAYLIGGWKPKAKNVLLVGAQNRYGARWHHGPLYFEGYLTDEMPHIDEKAHSRMIIWQPITRADIPNRWHRSWVQMNSQQQGFADIGTHSEYWKIWSAHAQRHRKKWLKDTRYEIVEVTLAEFAQAYHKTGKLTFMRGDFVGILKRRLENHGEHVHLFAAREKESHRIISGLAVCDLPDVSSSVHLIAFIHPDFEKTSVGTGLIDHWFSHCASAHIRFPFFGLVWAPGDPKDWRGYSQFKRQFNLFLIRFPHPLIKFVRRKQS